MSRLLGSGQNLLAALLVLSLPALAVAERTITLGGVVTEITFALGAGDEVVAVDDSSVHPAAGVEKLPKVGYYRTVGAEGLLSLTPKRVMATSEAGPPAVLGQIEKTGVQLTIVPADPSVEAARERIRLLAAALQKEAAGAALVSQLDRELEGAREAVSCVKKAQPKVLFIFARGGANVMASGKGTAADEMIRLAGGRNAIGGWEGYKPLGAEAAMMAAPDILLVTSASLASMGGEKALFGLPGLAHTPAAKNGRVVVMDDLLLLGFGPRTGAAVHELATKLASGDCATP